MKWSGSDVAWEGIVAADPSMAVPFAVHVFVFEDEQRLRKACGDPKASAHSSTFDTVDSANVGALLMLSRDELHISLVAHEIAHIALLHHRNALPPSDRTGARRWLGEHPESIAEMIGNLTALVWFSIPEEIF